MPPPILAAASPPSAKVAVIGAGQLARMTHQAAVDLDIELVVLANSPDDAAVKGGAPYIVGSPANLDDLKKVAAGSDVITFDHELVPPDHLIALQQQGYLLQPEPRALHLAQNKLDARQLLSKAGFPVPPFAQISSIADITNFAEQYGWPVVIKAQHGGYDGRGVYVINSHGQLSRLFEKIFKRSLGESSDIKGWMVEQFVDIAAEVSILTARTATSKVAVYPAVQTTQQDGICNHLVMPAPLPAWILKKAKQMGRSIADAIGATGILAVEMFLTRDNELIVNELASRPHNSGHATIEGCATSQFHQHLRAILDWPLGSTEMRVPAAATVNLIGTELDFNPSIGVPLALAIENVAIHLYGKTPRKGRKLGHVTAVSNSPSDALELARRACDCFFV
ncbi:MAG: 5-(carboxyamino)imidazole ribonucleotide synthase [Actinobacteria bacterium]|nr:5-(carboxyamino)imidazole ribonucleotide synthase [Actinomycetota bacterium]MCL6105379.1 5-(carboxyamino)imidazole ribonucleotide synthase [Actinomycetota bacterium]